MRLAVACCSAWMASALAGCAAAPAVHPTPGVLPMSIGNGAGSQHGNYAARPDGETRGPAGERCVIFNWDRPLTGGLAVRLRSMSCESRERPGWMIATQISRTVIPLSQSNLKDE
ncbi:MAG: hypothetical protein RLO51_13890 [Thalassobaculum sp.]|uniref:hypothetical protein n=1 Tax=Thalassobaculum sp. TaxID=2022740 RepID=UPI0032EEBED5